jgi:predicted Zn-dependent protease
MAPNDKHLAMALDLLAKAERETDPEKRAKLEALAESYRRTGESKSAIDDADGT